MSKSSLPVSRARSCNDTRIKHSRVTAVHSLQQHKWVFCPFFFFFLRLSGITVSVYCVVLSYSKGFSVFGESSQSIVSGLGVARSRVRAETTFTCSNLLVNSSLGEPVWPSGKALVRLVRGGASVRIRFGSPLSSEVVVCAHCLLTLSLTINQTLKCGSHRCPS